MTKATSIPARDSTFSLADGRTVAFSEWGDLSGTPVVLLHGRPGSRLLCPDLDATEAAGVRLITVDRPGYGRSDPRVDTTLLDWVDDFVALIDHLELPACPVIGWSMGGPYALACAHRLPDRVPAIGQAAGGAPLDEVPGAWDELSAADRGKVELVRTDRPAGIELIVRNGRWYDGDGWESIFTEPWGVDEPYLQRPDAVSALKAWFREGARQGSLGLAADDVADASTAGFSVSDIQQRVHVWIGEADPHVEARIHADYLMSALPRATLVTYPGEGHMFPLAHWGEMLAAVT